ncbi:tRNA (adenosine(37)-N6)-threonylcarbamoyltransferase complex dimerization subunit type 1 TsaB [Desulfuribacillus stibiiarsenatis]|uniref:tRNA (Adenosine(37)-N6)-threonylcarbamoyltransferase complex dimerization subunit type 1 TsaB n=1 Tax=Desulfuribacillus stibiiarsenatis TaxID=1390249 RepID=A0A1E5L589_9FIRM|nr:tRNA (adenosine(37)-N6)-threonylcarbamoyltransferase complex dimerization subunit type 1 TsaB [Desulfuribacillus stibiiarsenatis]OEH85228.1 tRNA (adenosine(37)-N6)-threonylcarbamoyltransferase complex dimerization subunit type 1 TsaB [Desulfuribacillus stibiiarsenatis]
MPYLAIDTSTQTLSVALGTEESIIAEYTTNVSGDHSSRLMPAIEHMMKVAKITPKDLKGIIVAKGPGSYTGLRIGVSTAKSFAWSLNLPLIGVSSLSVIAHSCKGHTGVIVPVIDARRGQVFTGVYKSHCSDDGSITHLPHNDLWKAIEGDRLTMFTDWICEISGKYERILFVGHDIHIHKKTLEQFITSQEQRASDMDYIRTNIRVASVSRNLARASSLLEIGLGYVARGEIEDVKSFSPEYLRLAEAEYNWLQQQKLGVGSE